MTGRRLAVAALCLLGGAVPASASSAAAGDLARGFGTGGVVKLRDLVKDPSGMATGPGGGIFVLGRDDCGGKCDSQLAVSKFGPDGSLNRRYGVEGKAPTALGVDAEAVFTVDRRGRALVMGRMEGAPGAAIVRLDAGGRPDRSFGADGVAMTPAYGNFPDLIGVESTRRGGFYAIASWQNNFFAPGGRGRDTTSVISMARFVADGTVDGGYGSGGEFRHNFADIEGLGVAAERRSGGVVVFGTTCCADRRLPTAARVDAQGRLDRRFGLWQGFGGIRRIALYRTTDALVRRNGKIDLYGDAVFEIGMGRREAAGFVVRLRRNGRPLGRFGPRHGIRFKKWPIKEVALDGRGRTVGLSSNLGSDEPGVFRLRPGGASDGSFASGGLATIPFPIRSGNVSLDVSYNRPVVLDEVPEACAPRGPSMCSPANPVLVALKGGSGKRVER